MANAQQSRNRDDKVSSAVEPLGRQLKEKGFADVMVFLNEAAQSKSAMAASMGVASGVGGTASVSFAAAQSAVPMYGRSQASLPPELMKCFESAYEESHEEGTTSLSLRGFR